MRFLAVAVAACQVTKSFRAGKVLTGARVRCAARVRRFSFSWAT